jgi:hypothetical protein
MRVLFIAALCISLMFYAGMTFAESDEICCTWVNTNYVSGDRPQKLMFNFDGTFVTYNTKTSTEALQRGTFQIVKKWKDSEENIWYKIKMQNPKYGTKYKLAKVSNDGDKLEFVCKSDKYPAEIDKNEPEYCNYLRASIH